MQVMDKINTSVNIHQPADQLFAVPFVPSIHIIKVNLLQKCLRQCRMIDT